MKYAEHTIVLYKNDERVRVLAHIGDMVNIWIPSRQEAVWVKESTITLGPIKKGG